MNSAIIYNEEKYKKMGLKVLAVLDESASYEVDITELHYDPKTKELVLWTASGCSCWDGDFDEERFKSLGAVKKSLLTEEKDFNPSFKGAYHLIEEAREKVKEYKL